MTRYLVKDTEIQDAIYEAIDSQNKDPQGNNYIIASFMDVVRHVLRLLDRYKVVESEQTNKPNQDNGHGMIGEPFSLSLFIPGIPASKGSYRPITGRSRTTGKPVTRLIPMDKKERPWRDHVRDTILSHRTLTIPHNSYITVETTFYLPRPKTIPPSKRKHPTVKPDIDKLQRALYDAITETHIWHDDCQITDVTSHKRYADNTPTGVSLTITWERNQ